MVLLLSPCGTELPLHENGAREQEVMVAILTIAQEYLVSSGVISKVYAPEKPAVAAVSYANQQRVDLLFLMRSGVTSSPVLTRRSSFPAGRAVATAAPTPGGEIRFHPASQKSRRAATLLQEHLREVAPHSGYFSLTAAPRLPDFRMVVCPAVQLRLGLRDHAEDAAFMQQSGVIAHALAKALCAWCDVPCRSPSLDSSAVSYAPGGHLALRSAPHLEGELLQSLPNGTALTLLHQEGAWQYVELGQRCGYVMRKYIKK